MSDHVDQRPPGRSLNAGWADAEDCVSCGEAIEPWTEHFPHEHDCERGADGWCTCHLPSHPDCCTDPDCA